MLINPQWQRPRNPNAQSQIGRRFHHAPSGSFAGRTGGSEGPRGVVNASALLLEAAKIGDLKGVRKALAQGAYVDARDNEYTALMLASESDFLKVARLLIKKGADVNASNSCDVTVLMRASSGGHPKMVELLLKKGADVHAKDWGGDTALTHADEGRTGERYEDYNEVFRLLRQHGAK